MSAMTDLDNPITGNSVCKRLGFCTCTVSAVRQQGDKTREVGGGLSLGK